MVSICNHPTESILCRAIFLYSYNVHSFGICLYQFCTSRIIDFSVFCLANCPNFDIVTT